VVRRDEDSFRQQRTVQYELKRNSDGSPAEGRRPLSRVTPERVKQLLSEGELDDLVSDVLQTGTTVIAKAACEGHPYLSVREGAELEVRRSAAYFACCCKLSFLRSRCCGHRSSAASRAGCATACATWRR